MERLTKQGVRNLDPPNQPRPSKKQVPLNCEHKRMRVCCYIKGRPCGHWKCPDCGLYWDDAAGC